jgi:undecaprenyl-diphosphatase
MASAALMAVVLGVYLYLSNVGPLPGETRLADAIRLPPTGDHVDVVAILMSFLGDPLVAAILVVFLVAGAWEESGRDAAALVAAAAGVVMLTKLLKSTLGSTQAGASPSVGLANYPSGTTAFVTSLFGMLGWLAWRSGHRVAAAGCALLVLAVGPSVVAVSEHYPSDALAGYAAGVAWPLAILAVGGWLAQREQRP